ncbi:hypothetical protein H4218_000262 [Coemansia sp. IMI 209128]|nr:hypothetical protein H4218_000262 [Coemansia sp. IMI 209128]
MVIDWFPTHTFKERQYAKTAVSLSNEKPVVRSSSPEESSSAKPSPAQRKDIVDTAPMPHLEQVDMKGETALLGGAKRCVEISRTKTRLTDFSTATMAAPLSVSLPPITVEGLENDKSKRVEDERIADSPLQAFAKRKRPLAGTGYTFCDTLQTEASAAIPIVGAKESQCLANADALFETRPVHSYTADEGSSDSDYSLVDDMLITEIRPDTGEIVCHRVPITYKSSASQN